MDLPFIADPDRLFSCPASRDFEFIGKDLDAQVVPAVVNLHSKPSKFFGKAGIEPQHVAPGFKARVSPLDHVDAPGHGTQMNAFGRAASLDVGNVAFQGLGEKIP